MSESPHAVISIQKYELAQKALFKIYEHHAENLAMWH
jgi:hypothetical protein